MDWLSSDSPLIIGHRGASADAPENTLEAFRLAAVQGAQGIELDVQLSADGQVVVMHDHDVDRTTNGQGPVARLTATELQALDAGGGQPVPLLDDVFHTFGADFLYNVELKGYGLRDAGLEKAVAELIATHGLHAQVVVSSFDAFSCRRARRYLPRETMVAVLRYRGPRWLPHLVVKADAHHPDYQLVDESFMVWARRRDYRVHVWTVDSPTEAQRLAALGVHGIITNRPALLREALNA